jgi:hypothetical protein
MEIVEQIKRICIETNNEWFLMNDFTTLAFCDLQLKEKFENENIYSHLMGECICQTTPGEHCKRCSIEMERDEEINKFYLAKHRNNIYDFKTYCYTQSRWIIPDNIDDEIPGFILIKCCNGLDDEVFTHELVFACVRPKYRKKGILKNMVNRIPKEWNIWLEANNDQISNVETIWEKCGFMYHKTMRGMRRIYKKLAF